LGSHDAHVGGGTSAVLLVADVGFAATPEGEDAAAREGEDAGTSRGSGESSADSDSDSDAADDEADVGARARVPDDDRGGGALGDFSAAAPRACPSSPISSSCSLRLRSLSRSRSRCRAGEPPSLTLVGMALDVWIRARERAARPAPRALADRAART